MAGITVFRCSAARLNRGWKRLSVFGVGLGLGCLLSLSVQAASDGSRLSDKPIKPNYDDYVRTEPLLELGEPFLDTGNIDPGFEIFTGAIWQPQFLVWGDMRTAFQDFDSGATHTQEWANRLNLFAQLRLTPTERILASIRPLDQGGRFTGLQSEPTSQTVNGFNSRLRTLYVEGDFGEIFPNLDPNDSKALDWGFAFGRQPNFTQEGLLINDNIDALGIVRNSIRITGASNTRVAGIVAWNEVHRGNNVEDPTANLWGLFIESDIPCCTIDIDLAYVDSEVGADGLYAAFSSVQTIGHLNSSLRFLYSESQGAETAAISTGTLLFAETSWVPTGTHDNIYINGYLGIDQFTSAARDVSTGGPLGRTGILFASVGLGNYGAALNNDPADSIGGVVGYQKFSSDSRKQLIVELGGRSSTRGLNTGAAAIGARYQQAFGKHTILVLDGFINDTSGSGGGSGLRAEMRWKF